MLLFDVFDDMPSSIKENTRRLARLPLELPGERHPRRSGLFEGATAIANCRSIRWTTRCWPMSSKNACAALARRHESHRPARSRRAEQTHSRKRKSKRPSQLAHRRPRPASTKASAGPSASGRSRHLHLFLSTGGFLCAGNGVSRVLSAGRVFLCAVGRRCRGRGLDSPTLLTDATTAPIFDILVSIVARGSGSRETFGWGTGRVSL